MEKCGYGFRDKEKRNEYCAFFQLMKLMKHIFCFCLGYWMMLPLWAQKLKKADRALAANIAADVAGLSRDSIGASGNGQVVPKVCVFASGEFARMGMGKEGNSGSYFREIQLDRGRIISTKCALSLNGKTAVAGTEFYPLVGSPNGHTEGSAGVSLNERGLPWIYDLKYDLETGRGNAAFDLHKLLENKAVEAKKKGATALLLYNSSTIQDGLTFDANDKKTAYVLPVIYISRLLSSKVFKDATAYVDVNLTVAMEEKEDYAHNVEGFIDNGARRTVVLRASLDTLGCAAALIELARLLKQAGWKKHNYLVLGYSGERTEEKGMDSVDYRVDLGYLVPDPANPVMVVSALSDSDKWGNVFGAVKDNYLHVKFVNQGTVPGGRFSSFVLTTDGSAIQSETDYNREALAVRYAFKLMEAAENQ